MKTFLSIFLAIVAAGAVFYAFIDHQRKVENWQTAVNLCVIVRDDSLGKPQQQEDSSQQLVTLLENKPGWFGSTGAQLSASEATLLKDVKYTVEHYHSARAEALAQFQAERVRENPPSPSQPSPPSQPLPPPTPKPLPREVSIVSPVEIPLMSGGKQQGAVRLPVGAKVRLLGREGDKVRVQYFQTVTTIPASSTNLEP